MYFNVTFLSTILAVSGISDSSRMESEVEATREGDHVLVIILKMARNVTVSPTARVR